MSSSVRVDPAWVGIVCFVFVMLLLGTVAGLFLHALYRKRGARDDAERLSYALLWLGVMGIGFTFCLTLQALYFMKKVFFGYGDEVGLAILVSFMAGLFALSTGGYLLPRATRRAALPLREEPSGRARWVKRLDITLAARWCGGLALVSVGVVLMGMGLSSRVLGILLILAGIAYLVLVLAPTLQLHVRENRLPRERSRARTGPWLAKHEDQAASVAAGERLAHCPACGSDLPADAPEGLCPACLLGAASRHSAPDRAREPGGHGPFAAPTAADLAPHFPQLDVLDVLGQGGMGTVYRARQTKLDRLVALKVLASEWGKDPAFAERFAREARALAKLNHPHIVGVHDFGAAGGSFYLLMEYVEGVDLRHALLDGPLPPEQALAIAVQVCDALQYAHEEGVVHRDVKPENILLDRRGRVKLADFGLAKLLGPSHPGFTLTGSQQVMGTFDYMAPEQRLRPQDVDHRADVYSLGVVLYEMLTGELPLGRFAAPSQRAAVDARLDELVFRALDRDPEQRFQRLSEVREELAALAGGRAATSGQGRGGIEARRAEFIVRGPAIALKFTAAIALLQWIVLGYFFLFSFVPSFSPHDDTHRGVLVFGGLLGAILVIGAVGILVAGASRLERLEGYGTIVWALILAVLPWSWHIVVGIPAAIWAVYALTRPEVQAAFHGSLKPADRPARRRVRGFWDSVFTLFRNSAAEPAPALEATPQGEKAAGAHLSP